jgi:hypothetical protein
MWYNIKDISPPLNTLVLIASKDCVLGTYIWTGLFWAWKDNPNYASVLLIDDEPISWMSIPPIPKD